MRKRMRGSLLAGVAFVAAAMLGLAVPVGFPVKAETAISLRQSDFDSAKNGTPQRGISYNEDMDCYELAAGKYRLEEDISLGSLSVYAEESGVYELDLNKKTMETDGLGSMLYFYNCEAIITGDGTLRTNQEGAGCVVVNYPGKLTIESGTFIGNVYLGRRLQGDFGSFW